METYRLVDGRFVVTDSLDLGLRDEDILMLAAEAERGYDLGRIVPLDVTEVKIRRSEILARQMAPLQAKQDQYLAANRRSWGLTVLALVLGVLGFFLISPVPLVGLGMIFYSGALFRRARRMCTEAEPLTGQETAELRQLQREYERVWWPWDMEG